MFCVWLPSSVHWHQRCLCFTENSPLMYSWTRLIKMACFVQCPVRSRVFLGYKFAIPESKPINQSSNDTGSRKNTCGKDWPTEGIVLNVKPCKEFSKRNASRKREGTPSFQLSPLSLRSTTKVNCLSLTTWFLDVRVMCLGVLQKQWSLFSIFAVRGQLYSAASE